jgi:hypothetical protein
MLCAAPFPEIEETIVSMRRIALLLSCTPWLAALAAFAAAQTDWILEEDRDAMTDRRVAVASTRVDPGRAREHTLEIRCSAGDLAARIGVGEYVPSEQGRTTVLLRWDEQAPTTRELELDEGRGVILVDDPVGFGTRLRAHDRLRVRVFERYGTPIDLDFSLVGSAVPVQAVLDACTPPGP